MSLTTAMQALGDKVRAALPTVHSAGRVYYPDNLPNPLEASTSASSSAFVLVYQPQLLQAGRVDTYLAVVDVCAKSLVTARASADLLLAALKDDIRAPTVFSSPRAPALKESWGYRVNVAVTIRLK